MGGFESGCLCSQEGRSGRVGGWMEEDGLQLCVGSGRVDGQWCRAGM